MARRLCGLSVDVLEDGVVDVDVGEGLYFDEDSKSAGQPWTCSIARSLCSKSSNVHITTFASSNPASGRSMYTLSTNSSSAVPPIEGGRCTP
ncbi:hypothetical protein BT69DRAFT_1286819 [Atractiella rhizophila]|nr:hypothetical protein BT69DRAFT_1286819 [Atractiella rhizophila]